MAKKKQTRKKQTEKTQSLPPLKKFDLDEVLDKYIWWLLPLLVLAYFWFSSGSTGFYQDDEIGHYRNIRQFWGDPFSIMGNQPKPGWKILMVIPGLFGFTGVVLAHCFIAALTVIMTYKLGRVLKIRNSSLGAILLAAQPLFLQLSFRSYSEITAALFIILTLYFYYRENFILAAISSSWVFAIRQEFALVSLAMGLLFLYRKQWLPFLLLAWTPVALALIGWISTGNMTWLIDDMMRIGLGVEVPHKPFWHYFGTYMYMVGPVTMTLLIVGYWRVLYPPGKARGQISEHGLLFFTYTIMFAWAVISAWDLPDFGANPGHWRYMISIAPLTAIYAAKGINVLQEPGDRGYVFGVLGAFTLIAFLFLARETNGLVLIEEARYDHVLVVGGILLLYVLFSVLRLVDMRTLVIVLAVLAVGFTFYTERPRELDLEASTVKEASEWYLAQPEELQQRPLYGNHVLFRYFADIDINDKRRDLSMQLETLSHAPKGAIVVWDSHYGNSQFGGDVPMEYFEQHLEYRLLKQIVTEDRTFGLLIFEKMTEPTAIEAPSETVAP